MPKSIDELLVEVRARYERVDAVTAARECDGGALLVDTRPVEYRREHGEVPGRDHNRSGRPGMAA
jgi:hypothetical protein